MNRPRESGVQRPGVLRRSEGDRQPPSSRPVRVEVLRTARGTRIPAARSAASPLPGRVRDYISSVGSALPSREGRLSGPYLVGPWSAKAVRAVLVCCAALLFVLAALPVDSVARTLAASGAAWAAQAFAIVAFVVAFKRSADRTFLALLGGAVLLRFVSDLIWTNYGVLGALPTPGYQVAAEAVSYPLFFVALFRLLRKSRQEMTPLALLDASGLVLSSGLLLWHFLLSPATAAADLYGWEAFETLAQAVGDLGLLFLALCILLAVRSLFAALLAGGISLLVVADGAHLGLQAGGVRALDDWPELSWAVGVTLLGLAALRRGAKPSGQGFPRTGNLEAFLFWLGPLSPPMQYGVLLIWGAFHPPLPTYVLLYGAVLMAVLATRTYAANYVGERLVQRKGEESREAEQGRILRELHDTVKQNVRGTSMMVEACVRVHEKGDSNGTRDLLERTLEISRETDRQLSKPLDELRLSATGNAVAPTAFFKERFEKFGRDFGMRTHEDLGAPLESLKRDEIVVAHRVCIETCWNAAKHSGATNLWLTSRREGSVFSLSLSDDGRGFSPEEATDGLGLSFMRSRAEEVGAVLDVISAPGRGTTIELRFGQK